MRRLALVSLSAGALFLLATSLPFAQAHRSPFHRQLQGAKAATAQFHSIERALAAGYVQPPGPVSSTCVSSPAGGMGVHFENPALMADPVLRIRRPEILLYAPGRNGKLRLIGLEYFKNDVDQNLATDSDRPTLFGHAFDGPMEGHHPGMGIHYDLHVWLWKKNPSGLFAMFNPNVHCPAP